MRQHSWRSGDSRRRGGNNHDENILSFDRIFYKLGSQSVDMRIVLYCKEVKKCQNGASEQEGFTDLQVKRHLCIRGENAARFGSCVSFITC